MIVSRRRPTKFVAISCAAMFAASLSIAAFADVPTTTGDPESLGFSAARLARIDAWYQARVDAGDVSGSVVAIAKGGKLAYLQAIGFQDRGKTIPMKPDSIFWIASMTKPITSVAAMVLVEDGRLNLDSPVLNYLPELAGMQVGVEKAEPATGKAEIAFEPPRRPMTIRDLLRHTSGLVYPPQYVDAPINRLYRKAAFERDRTLAEFVASLVSLPLAHQPGEVWEYSWGVDVLARVVEVASGQPFDQFLQTRIFEPLRMVDTGFYVPEAKLARLVEAPTQRNPQFDVTRPRKLLSGGGGLVSTAADYLRFCHMLLNDGELDGVRILAPRTVQLMTTNSLPTDVRFVGSAIGPATGSGFGLGFAIRTNPESSSIPGSVGSYTWNGTWGTYFWIDPAEKLIVISMIQVAPGKASPYFAAIRNLTYGAMRVPEPASFSPLTSPPTSPLTTRAETLADYVGTYDFGMSSSSRDKMNSIANNFVGIGVDIQVVDSGVKIAMPRENGPAAGAGVRAGDFITKIDDVPVKGFTINQIIDKLRGAANSQVRLSISREGQQEPVEITIVRALIYAPAVELQTRTEAGKLVIEATGPWPVLEFEKGKPVTVAELSNNEFYVEGGDHTRIAFRRDSTGKVVGMALNPGPWEQEGVRIGRRPS